VLVVILDGWGVNHEDQYNAVFSADTPCTDALKAAPRRYRSVRAHGTAVGLPSDADMGNSEVGHNALGSGQVIDQGARLVDQALANGQMFELPGWKLISQAFAQHTVHFIGLLSDGGVHSRYDQLVGCVTGAVERGAKRVRVHILTGVCVRGCHAWGGKRGVWSQQAAASSRQHAPAAAAHCAQTAATCPTAAPSRLRSRWSRT
jgi:2,3-bisphosphoglycerate-independent phosphoglycerate mutase